MWKFLLNLLKGAAKPITVPAGAVKAGVKKVAGTKAGQAAASGAKKGASWFDDQYALKAALSEAPDLAYMYFDPEGGDTSDVIRTGLRLNALRLLSKGSYVKGRALKEILNKSTGTPIQKGFKKGESRADMIKRAFGGDEKAFKQYATDAAFADATGKLGLGLTTTAGVKLVQAQLKDSNPLGLSDDYFRDRLMEANALTGDDNIDNQRIMKAKIEHYADYGRKLQARQVSRNIAQYLSSDSTFNVPVLGKVGIGSVIPAWKKRDYKNDVYSEDSSSAEFAQHVYNLTSNKPHFAQGMKLNFGTMTPDEARTYDYIFKNMTDDGKRNVLKQLELDGATDTINDLKGLRYFKNLQ